MKKVKVGIIGTGYTVGIAKQHATCYKANERAELAALYDIVPGRAAEWAKKYGWEETIVCDSMEELFSKVDAVSICTPNCTHGDLTIKALEAGKHLICEKPFVTSYEVGKRAVEYAKAHPNLIAMIAFNYREIPEIKFMKKLIDEGKIGKVFTYRHELGGNRIANTGVKLEWRMQEQLSGSGALSDFGCHMLDLADFLLSGSQGNIKEVFAMTNTCISERTTLTDPDKKGKVTNDDCALFNARMESGALLSFVTSRIGVPRQMIEIVGEGGMLISSGNDKIEIELKDKQGGYTGKKEEVAIPEEYKGEEGHRGLINEFINAILDRKQVTRGLERGLYIQYILDMLKKSADETRLIKL